MAETQTEVQQPQAEAGFPPFDTSTYPSQLLWLAISFGLLYYVVSKIALPRITSIMTDRHDRIASDKAEAESLTQQTDQAIADYEQALKEARDNAHAMAQSTRDKLNAEATAKRTKVEAELAEKLKAAETSIADIKTKAMGEVDSIATETTSTLIETLLGKGVKDTNVAKAVSDQLKAN